MPALERVKTAPLNRYLTAATFHCIPIRVQLGRLMTSTRRRIALPDQDFESLRQARRKGSQWLKRRPPARRPLARRPHVRRSFVRRPLARRPLAESGDRVVFRSRTKSDMDMHHSTRSPHGLRVFHRDAERENPVVKREIRRGPDRLID